VARSRAARAAGLLVLIGLLGVAATATAVSEPATHVAGRWPVGLASGLLVFVGRRHLRPAAAALYVVVAAGMLLGGYPTQVSLGYAVGLTLEAVVTAQLLNGRWGDRRLSDDLDLLRYTGAAAAGALTGAALFAATSALTGFGVPWQVAVATFLTHVTSQLILLAFFMEEFRHPGFGGRGERLARWTLVIAVTVLAFGPSTMPSLVFLLLPLLGWTAMRAPMREALWQLVAVSALSASFMSVGRGPFDTAYALSSGPAEFAALPFQVFLLGCALVCIPFAMAVSRQQRSAAEAATERERLRRVVEGATSLAIIQTDEVGRITLFNPGAEALLGYSEQEVLGSPPDILLTPEEIERHARQLGVGRDVASIALASTQPDVGPRDWVFVRKDGAERTMSMALVAIRDNGGPVVGYLATAEDITERVRTQSALETALAAERKAVSRLTEVDRTKDAFVSSVSHELRTPITNIVGYLELLQDGAYGPTTAPQGEALNRIDTNSQRLLELIDDLLTLSQIEALDVEMRREPVDLSRLAREAAERLRSSATARGLRLEVQVPNAAVRVLGDADRLHRMLSNLADNAVKFTPHGGTVRLRLVADLTTCSLEVEDTGVGIPAEEQHLLFNRFFRSSHAQSEAIPGSGLGLSIARTIAQRHGARIAVDSARGRGSVFRVSFNEHLPTERTPAQRGRGPRVPAERRPSDLDDLRI